MIIVTPYLFKYIIDFFYEELTLLTQKIKV